MEHVLNELGHRVWSCLEKLVSCQGDTRDSTRSAKPGSICRRMNFGIAPASQHVVAGDVFFDV